jgi:hypothetical protein
MIEEARLRAVVRANDQTGTYRVEGDKPQPEDAKRILGIAAMMIQADEHEFPEEFRAFHIFADEVRAVTGAKDETTLDDHLSGKDEEGRRENARILASELSCPAARAIAYKIAVALRDCDDAVERREFDLEDMLIEALALTPERAEALTAEVHEAMAGDDLASDPST